MRVAIRGALFGLMVLLTIPAAGKEPQLPIWDQYPVLICQEVAHVSCDTESMSCFEGKNIRLWRVDFARNLISALNWHHEQKIVGRGFEPSLNRDLTVSTILFKYGKAMKFKNVSGDFGETVQAVLLREDNDQYFSKMTFNCFPPK